MKQIIDLSAANGTNHNLYEATQAGISCAFLRTGEGLHGQDPAFSKLSAMVHAQGWMQSSYHLMAPSSGDPEGQALAMFTLAGKPSPKDCPPPFVDCERNSPLTGVEPKAWADCLTRMLAKGDELFQRTIGLYVGTYFLAPMRPFLSLETLDRPIWIPAYPSLMASVAGAGAVRQAFLAARAALGKAPGNRSLQVAYQVATAALVATKDLPNPIGNPPANATLWQYAGDANGSTCPGISTLCDRSTFFGDDDAWAKFCNMTSAPASAAIAGEVAASS